MTRERVPIGEYGLVGDTRTAALVAPDGSIDWWCLPRFDSPPVFGRLVGGDAAGWLGTGPAEPARLGQRRYRDATTTLEATWSVEGGELTMLDTMIAENSRRLLPTTTLVRRLTSRGRTVHASLRVSPRFGHARVAPARVRKLPDALLVEHAGLVLTVQTDAPIPLAVDEVTTFAVDPRHPGDHRRRRQRPRPGGARATDARPRGGGAGRTRLAPVGRGDHR
jgi:hypothetical protein